MAAPQAADRFKEVGEEDITRLRGMLFGIITQMQHLHGVANMIVSPSGALSPLGFAFVLCTMTSYTSFFVCMLLYMYQQILNIKSCRLLFMPVASQIFGYLR